MLMKGIHIHRSQFLRNKQYNIVMTLLGLLVLRKRALCRPICVTRAHKKDAPCRNSTLKRGLQALNWYLAHQDVVYVEEHMGSTISNVWSP